MTGICRNLSISYRLLLLFILAVGLCSVGCGGSSSSSSPGPSTPNPFAGRYVGTFTNSLGDTGAAYVNVSTAGAITGTGIDSTTKSAFALSGTITALGATTLIPSTGNTSHGTLTLNGSNQIVGTLTDTASVTINLTGTPATGGTAPLYAGALTGTFGASNGDVGTVTLIVDANGIVTGVVHDTTQAQTVTTTGTLTNAGAATFTNILGSGTGNLAFGVGNNVTGTVVSGATTVTLILTHS
jgi:hypothetical protein